MESTKSALLFYEMGYFIMKTNKILATILAAASLLSTLPCGAVSAANTPPMPLSPDSLVSTTSISDDDYYYDPYVTIKKESATKCSYTGGAQFKPVTTKMKGILILEEYRDGHWKEVKRKEVTTTSDPLRITDSYSSLVSGRKYRSRLYLYAYCGVVWEFASPVSNVIQ